MGGGKKGIKGITPAPLEGENREGENREGENRCFLFLLEGEDREGENLCFLTRDDFLL